MKRYFFLFIVAIAGLVPMQAQRSARIEHSLAIYNDVLRLLDLSYVDTLNYEDLTETAINALLRKVDPYTVYYPKKKENDLKMMTTGKYGGIGAIIQQQAADGSKLKKSAKKDSVITVIANPYEGKPAQRNGVWAGDQILEVDGWKTAGHSVSEVSDHLRGDPGTMVRLKLLRPGTDKPLTKKFLRESVHLEPVSYYAVFDSVGYIDLSEFTEGAAQSFQNAVYKMVNEQGAKSLIIDLRGNGGGLVDEAVQILSNFVEKGTMVVSMKGKAAYSSREYTTSSYPLFPDMPLVVLVDKNSASASEIVSGALQDLKRATLIGQRTFGKGLVQNVRPIAYEGHLKVTTAKYYLPSGRCIQAIDYAERQKGNELKRDTAGGILPDIVLSDSAKVDISYELYVANHFFQYATRFHLMHDTIASPETFHVDSALLEDFCLYLDSCGFTYETETSKYMDDLLKMAREEDLEPSVIADLEAFVPRLKPSFRDAIFRHREEIERLLGGEIVLRYYYQKGSLAYALRYDNTFARALQVLNNNK